LGSLLVLFSVFGVSLAKAPTSFTVTATAYTSLASQTDGSPFITATGARTRLGIIAVSRDLLADLPYGSRVKLQELNGGRFNRLFSDRVFVVEDTMHTRWRNKIDVWFPDNATAIRFGVRKLKVTVLQVGRG
jgi:3D (Asp-Asp-Asp) domain-containing protein